MRFIQVKDNNFVGYNNIMNKTFDVRATYKTIVSVFGKPKFFGNSGDNKVNFMWHVKTKNGNDIFVSNCKNLAPYLENGKTFEEVMKGRVSISWDIKTSNNKGICFEIIKLINNKRMVLVEKTIYFQNF